MSVMISNVIYGEWWEEIGWDFMWGVIVSMVGKVWILVDVGLVDC